MRSVPNIVERSRLLLQACLTAQQHIPLLSHHSSLNSSTLGAHEAPVPKLHHLSFLQGGKRCAENAPIERSTTKPRVQGGWAGPALPSGAFVMGATHVPAPLVRPGGPAMGAHGLHSTWASTAVVLCILHMQHSHVHVLFLVPPMAAKNGWKPTQSRRGASTSLASRRLCPGLPGLRSALQCHFSTGSTGSWTHHHS